MSNIINVPMAAQRDIQTVTVEIRQLHRQGQEAALRYIVEIGRRLQEAKELLPHGEWGQWVKEELPFSQSTAQNFMRIFQEYGADQLEIGGAVKSQALANLSYTKALKLLAIDDEEEREAFVETHNVDDMSSRELEEAIRERDEARRMQAEAEKRAKGFEAQAVDAAAEAEKKVAELNEALAKAKKQRDTARDKLKNAEAAVELLKQQKEDKPPQEENETSQEENEKGESAPAAGEEELRRRIQAEEAAKAEEAVKALEAKVKEAEEKAEAMRVKLAMADPATAVFAQLFSDFGKCFEKLRGKYAEIVEKNGTEAAAKLKKAMQVQLQRFTEDVEVRW